MRWRIVQANPLARYILNVEQPTEIGKLPEAWAKSFEQGLLHVALAGKNRTQNLQLGEDHFQLTFFPISEDQIGCQIQETTEEIQRKIQQSTDLKEADQESEEYRLLLSKLNYELRTPLNGLVGMAGLLSENGLNETQSEQVKIIELCAGRLRHTIEEIGQILKLEQAPKEPGLIELDRILEDSLTQAHHLAQGKFIELFCQVAPEVPQSWMGDATKLQQVLASLLRNGVQHTEMGNVAIKVTRPDERSIEFCVEDQGVGMDEATLAHAFDSGRGLGLSLSKKLVELMEGQIWLKSKLGLGTKAHFSLPLTDPQQDHLPQTSLDRSILILDPNPEHGLFLEEWLTRQGYRCKIRNPLMMEQEALLKEEADFVFFNAPAQYGYLDLAATCIRKLNQLNRGVLLFQEKGKPLPTAFPNCHFLPKPVLVGKLEQWIEETRERIPEIQKPKEKLGEKYPLKILVAEDSEMNQTFFRHLLGSFGYDPIIVSDGHEAIQQMQAERVDLLLLDIEMPRLNGKEVAKWLQASMPKEERPHVIAITAHSMEEDRQELHNMGVTNYLCKPIDSGELARNLQNFAESRQKT